MKIATVIVRVLLGLMFVVFGSNAFLHYMPMPQMSGHPGEFIGSMAATGYLQFVAAFQVLGGALLLIGLCVPLGLTLLGPIVVNIVIYHLTMDRAGMAMAALSSFWCGVIATRSPGSLGDSVLCRLERLASARELIDVSGNAVNLAG